MRGSADLEGAIERPGQQPMPRSRGRREEPDGESATRPSSPPGGTVAASSSRRAKSPELVLQTRCDSSGAPLAEACNLSRWEDKPRGFGLSVRVPTTLVAEITTDGNYCGPGSPTTIGGWLVFRRGILIRCMFGEGGEAWGGHLSGAGMADIVAVEAGQTILFPDRLVEPLEPEASLQRMIFRDGHGYPFTSYERQSA